jgi:hypothetical protein
MAFCTALKDRATGQGRCEHTQYDAERVTNTSILLEVSFIGKRLPFRYGDGSASFGDR